MAISNDNKQQEFISLFNKINSKIPEGQLCWIDWNGVKQLDPIKDVVGNDLYERYCDDIHNAVHKVIADDDPDDYCLDGIMNGGYYYLEEAKKSVVVAIFSAIKVFLLPDFNATFSIETEPDFDEEVYEFEELL